MTDYTELKRLVDFVLKDRRFCGDENHKALAEGVLDLIAESERLHKLVSWQGGEGNEVTISAGQLMKHMDERDLLKAENEALRKLVPSEEIIWCACGDGHAANSYGTGFMDANNGVCANCDAAMGKGEQP